MQKDDDAMLTKHIRNRVNCTVSDIEADLGKPRAHRKFKPLTRKRLSIYTKSEKSVELGPCEHSVESNMTCVRLAARLAKAAKYA